MSPHDDALNQLCPALGLARYDQDWAIAVADGGRIDEFVNFYFDHSDLSQYGKYLLFELIVASASDALEEGRPPSYLAAAAALVKSVGAEYKDVLDYWKNLGDEWPVSRWLRLVLNE